MTNREILATAMRQSAAELNCLPEDFERATNVITISAPNARARRYLKLPFSCQLVSYGSNVVASVSPALKAAAQAYLSAFAPAHCFETPNLHVLNDSLEPFGQRVCHMAEYFLPDVRRLEVPDCAYPVRILQPEDFAGLYLPQWSNALCRARKELDRLALAAYDGDALIGLAGASADCDTMWQIGIDVLPAYRRRGVAAALTGRLAAEILKRGIVPFYCVAWSNLGSVRNAISCGFRPAWVELTAKSFADVDELNGRSPAVG